jgi:hypothetical protein
MRCPVIKLSTLLFIFVLEEIKVHKKIKELPDGTMFCLKNAKPAADPLAGHHK